MIIEPEMTSLGPLADSIDPPERRATNPKPTKAWQDANADTSTDNASAGNLGGSKRQSKPSSQRLWSRRSAIAIVVVQALWAIVIPLKNIGVTLNPPTRPDETTLSTLTYELSSSDVTEFQGQDVIPLLRKVVKATLGRESARRELERSGSFDIDRVYSLLPLEDFAAAAQFYALEVQSTVFPGAVFTPRPFSSSSGSESSSSLITLLLRDAASSSDFEMQLACSADSSFMAAVRCGQIANGDPCPEGTAVTFDDDGRQTIDSLLYEITDVDLRKLAGGLQNNVGLLYVIDFFAQAMNALLVSRDWSTALEDLAFTQDVSEGLAAGSASSFANTSSNTNAPVLMATDAYIVAVRAAIMESTLLDSCIASELTAALFYTRALVLHEIQQILIGLNLYNVAAGPAVALPNDTWEVLAPMWDFNISISSGARTGKPHNVITRFFGSLLPVASRKFVDASFKLDRSSVSSTQVTGSSLRMIQYLSFFPGFVSVFTFEKRAQDELEYDFQSFSLLGAAGGGINTFQENVAGAGSAMVFPIAELSSSSIVDSYWDAEAHYAAWFQALESDSSTAPFAVFSSYLTIESVPTYIVTDDNPDTRCHRALFKVLTKIAYLALATESNPASYLMFMGDVDEGHRTWLLRNIDTEELFGESLFGAGDRIGFPYRNGKFTRKDDGSAWVMVPVLLAMKEAFGADSTLAILSRELDDSFAAFTTGSSNGVLHFPDARYCRVSGIGQSPSNATSYVVTTSDSLEEIYAKISTGLVSSLSDLLDQIPTLETTMYTSTATTGSSPLISQDQILGNTIVTVDTELRGPPTLHWKFTAITAGLRKLWPPRTPLNSTVSQVRAATRCYSMVELRTLSTTTRCMLEPRSTRVRFQMLSSEAMRSFFQGNWSMCVLLNTLALVVIAKYHRKLSRAYDATNEFARLEPPVARQLGLQATGVLKISQSLLLLSASVPLVLAFHVPDDDVFLPDFATFKPSKLAIDILVTLSMSWVWKVGFEVTNDWLQPWNWSAKLMASRTGGSQSPKQAPWLVGAMYWQHEAIARLKWGALAIVLISRLATRDGGSDSHYRARRLAATVCSTLAFGAFSSALVAFWRPLPVRFCCFGGKGGASRKVTVDDQSAERDEQDAVIAALVQQKLPLHRYGVLGRTARGGWSKAALIVEGWRLAKRTSDGREVLRKGAGEIVLPSEPLLSSQDGDSDSEGTECEVFRRSEVVPTDVTELETRSATSPTSS